MKLAELKAFLADARFEAHEDVDRDDCGNLWDARIYEKDGELYRICFLNGRPLAKDQDRKGVGVYLPQKVVKFTRLVEEVRYEAIGE